MQSRQCGLCVVSLLCIGVTHLTYLNEVTMFIAGKFNSSSILGEVGVFLKSFPFSLPFVIRSVSLNWKGPLGLPLHLLKCKVEHDRLHFDNLPSLIPLVRGGGGASPNVERKDENVKSSLWLFRIGCPQASTLLTSINLRTLNAPPTCSTLRWEDKPPLVFVTHTHNLPGATGWLRIFHWEVFTFVTLCSSYTSAF